MAGVGQITLTYPGEVIFTRLALNGSKLYTGPRYSGILDCVGKSISMDGFASLYNGYLITLLSGTPYVALQMSIYEMTQRTLLHNLDPGSLLYIPCKLIAGATASIIAQTVTFPGDVIRRRLQSDGMGGTAR
uniref:Calcium-binding mitochondrial carrier protein SCaMC-1 n=1 Tax=Lygus hesperus TaxID=30085 RepID=A0A0A9YPS1_LYGHE